MAEKVKILKVTTTRHYIVPMIDDKRTKINGWEIDKVIEDWFINHDLDMHHATREGHRIGNSKCFIDATILDPEDTIFFRAKEVEKPIVKGGG